MTLSFIQEVHMCIIRVAWALVKWTEEDRFSVIPSGWVVTPTPLLVESFLLKGCYWKKNTSTFCCNRFRYLYSNC